MPTENPTFQIPRDVIEPIIQAHVSTAIAGALSGYQNLVEKTVAFILNQKVDDHGKPSTYNSAKSFIEWAVKDSIETATKEILHEALEKNKTILISEIKKELQKKNSPIARQLAESMAGAISNVPTWNIHLNMEIKNRG